MSKFSNTRLAAGSRRVVSVAFLLAVTLSVLTGCSGGDASDRNDYAYVAVAEAGLRDHVSTIYAKTGLVHNGERLQVLERTQNKRFVRVRSPRGE
ncbi:MAG TPA: hypothetical protein VE133_19720, partial [Candidatus Sulfotelmatobacter sp.]|nr:hypothetical protein [Candidatus Sulfotelmatobacter sp.]